MEKSKKIGAQIYGYMVCLVAVITFLIAVTSLVNAVINLSDPLHSGWNREGSPSLSSFENFKMDVLKTTQKGDESVKANYIPDDQTLRAMYDAAKNDKIQLVKHQSNGTIITSAIIILICIVLFISHWRWMRNMSRSEA